MTIKSRKGDIIVSDDEYPRHGATIEAMGKLQAGLRKGRHRDRGQRVGHQ